MKQIVSTFVKPKFSEVDAFKLEATYFKSACFSKSTTLFCLPGGGASKDYFDLAPNYSFARTMCARGYDVVTMDHIGTVSNPLPSNHPFLRPEDAVDYIFQALPKARNNSPLIGIGHSMGGMITTLLQAQHSPFNAIALFGSSAGGLEWGLSENEKKYIDNPEALYRDLEKITLDKFKMPFPPSTGGPSGKSITFGGESPGITKRLRDISCELYAAGGMMSMTRGSFHNQVEAINVPIFFAFGDHDIGIPPNEAPKDYINAASTELFILENTGHNHFAFSTIATLCENFDHWAFNLGA